MIRTVPYGVCFDPCSQANLPEDIHFELSEHQTFEKDGKAYLIARDGYRVKDQGENTSRLRTRENELKIVQQYSSVKQVQFF